MNRLLEGGCEPERPVALIQSGTLSGQTCLSGTINTIMDMANRWKPIGPVVIIIGEVVRMGQDLHWFNEALFDYGSALSKVTENSTEVRIR